MLAVLIILSCLDHPKNWMAPWPKFSYVERVYLHREGCFFLSMFKGRSINLHCSSTAAPTHEGMQKRLSIPLPGWALLIYDKPLKALWTSVHLYSNDNTEGWLKVKPPNVKPHVNFCFVFRNDWVTTLNTDEAHMSPAVNAAPANNFGITMGAPVDFSLSEVNCITVNNLFKNTDASNSTESW